MSEPEGLVEIVKTKGRGDALRALRDVLAEQISSCGSPRDVAALSRQLTDVLQQIDALPAPVAGTVVDELEERRKQGGRVTARPARSRRG